MLAAKSPTGYRLLYVLQMWSQHLLANGNNPRFQQLVRIVAGIVPHLADDIIDVPEDTLRTSLEQIIGTVRSVLDGDTVLPAPAGRTDDEADSPSER